MPSLNYGELYNGLTWDDYNIIIHNTTIAGFFTAHQGCLTEYTLDGNDTVYIIADKSVWNELMDALEDQEIYDIGNTFLYCGSTQGFSSFPE